MCELCRGDYQSRGEDYKKIKDVVHRIIREVHPLKVVLFGSFARGDWHEYSDADLMIVAEMEERFFERIGRILDLNDTDLEIEPLVYTPEEFERMLKEERPFAMRILEEGIVVYEKAKV